MERGSASVAGEKKLTVTEEKYCTGNTGADDSDDEKSDDDSLPISRFRDDFFQFL